MRKRMTTMIVAVLMAAVLVQGAELPAAKRFDQTDGVLERARATAHSCSAAGLPTLASPNLVASPRPRSSILWPQSGFGERSVGSGIAPLYPGFYRDCPPPIPPEMKAVWRGVTSWMGGYGLHEPVSCTRTCTKGVRLAFGAVSVASRPAS